MKKLTEGHKMFISVMVIFAIYAMIFILFEDYDRHVLRPFSEASDWHLLLFSIVVMTGLAFLLYHYARRMDERISREQNEKESRMRRELTQNIAHELKTPIASIMGYMETLLEHQDIGPDTEHQFILRTHAQAKRLTSLLQDLSILNRIDYAPEQIAKVQVNISEIVEEVSHETSLMLSKQEMTLQNLLPNDIFLNGDPTLLYGLFRNLFDNAILHAGKGTCIILSAKDNGNYWQFTFSDNGQGIADEHLPRIFERFYRVDKGRSRMSGGTGLGLSIVKHTVELHGGTIDAQAATPQGLRFVFTLQK